MTTATHIPLGLYIGEKIAATVASMDKKVRSFPAKLLSYLLAFALLPIALLIVFPFAWAFFRFFVNPALRKINEQLKTTPLLFGNTVDEFRLFYKMEKSMNSLRGEEQTIRSAPIVGKEAAIFHSLSMEFITGLGAVLYPFGNDKTPEENKEYRERLADWAEDWDGPEWVEFDLKMLQKFRNGQLQPYTTYA